MSVPGRKGFVDDPQVLLLRHCCLLSAWLQLSAWRRRQLALGDLVEQRLVADLENPSHLGPIPVRPFEHFHEGFALGLSRAAAGDLPQALGDDGRWPKRLSVLVPAERDQGRERALTI